MELFSSIYHCYSNLVNSLFCGFTQSQAGQAEKQIKAEFERLRRALVTDEALRLKALATEEEQKIAEVEDLITQINKDVAVLDNVIDSLKKEMGNEDLPLVRVRGGNLTGLANVLFAAL